MYKVTVIKDGEVKETKHRTLAVAIKEYEKSKEKGWEDFAE